MNNAANNNKSPSDKLNQNVMATLISNITAIFTSTLGTKALTRSWWRRWVYPVLFLITLTLSLATYLTLDSIQQSVDRYITDNQRALVGGDLVLESNQEWPAQVLKQLKT